jgi:hypothetical protein
VRHMFGLRIGWTVKCIKVLVADFVAEYVPVSTSHFGSQTHEMDWHSGTDYRWATSVRLKEILFAVQKPETTGGNLLMS